MSDNTPCRECGTMVLPSTAKHTGGLCMPCKNATRKRLDAAKELVRKLRGPEQEDSYTVLWRDIVDKLSNQYDGFNLLSEDEKLYYSVNILIGQVYNGGFGQYFTNPTADSYAYAECGLVQLKATNSAKLLRKAKEQIFGSNQVPKSETERWELIHKLNRQVDLDSLDTEFYKDHDNLESKLEAFALEVGLVKNA